MSARGVVRRTSQVREDIIEIYRFLHARNPSAADRVFDAIEASIRGLLETPGVGRYWNSPDPRLAGMRVTPVRRYPNYLLFFRAVQPDIELFRVVHGARDLQPLVDQIQLDLDDEDRE